MKYDKLRKLTRNRLLLEMHQKNLNTSLDEIGEIFNISRQRVQMILKKEKERLLKEARNG
ncbi:MAG: hypothetical protein DDT41_01510 [candidate division WS2 bacterium]|nr:hypothetical protein [Candidatus Psychracetigena formicireducens]